VEQAKKFTPEQVELLGKIEKQYRKALKGEKVKCAECDFETVILHLYRCYHCGLWFCFRCGKEHFGPDPTRLDTK